MKSKNIKYYLDKLYNCVQGCSDAITLCSSYSVILQIKHDNPSLASYNEPLYIDIKCFIDEYVSMVSHQRRDYGYDAVDVKKMETFIITCPDANQCKELFRHAYIQLSEKGFIHESEYFKEKYIASRAMLQIRNGNFRQKLIGVVTFTVNNSWLYLFILAVVVILQYVILLPCSAPEQAIFEISYFNYANNFCLNHFLNLLAYLLGINETLFCKPISAVGMLLTICFQLFYIVFVGGLAVDILKKKIL